MTTYSEWVESIESGGRCLLCGGAMDLETLQRLSSNFQDADVLEEGAERAQSEAEWLEEEEALESEHDFGDSGEDEEELL